MTDFNREAVLAILTDADTQVTARTYIREISRRTGVSARIAKTILRTLVDEKELVYQDLYGNTYVTRNFGRPVRVTDHFILSPPGMTAELGPRDIQIRLTPGISFGSGHHPTTRLCLAGLDHLFFATRIPVRTQPAADVGTGSGVLAVAACLAGASECQAFDIDANAVSEARRNAAANGLGRRVPVFRHPFTADGPPLFLICANLRFPTLKQLRPVFNARIRPGGILVFSGIRDWETDELTACYADAGFSPLWRQSEKNWTAVILQAP